MNNTITVPAYLNVGTENGKRSHALMFAASIVGHLIFLLILIFTPNQITAKRYTPSFINVSMVSLPAGNAFAQPGAKIPAPPKKPVAEPKPSVSQPKTPSPAPVQAPPPRPNEAETAPPELTIAKTTVSTQTPHAPDTISVAPKKKKVKVSLKKKTFRSTQVIKRAIKQIEKKTETSRPKTVVDAIDQLKDNVDETASIDQAMEQLRQKVGAEAGRGGSGGPPGRPGALGRRALQQIDLYKLEIAYHIEKRWAFSEQLSGGRTDLEAVLVIKIMPNGEIRDIWFEKKSGNSYFDDSAFKAVKKSNPLPPLPKEYVRPFYNVGLVFTPSGLRKGTG